MQIFLNLTQMDCFALNVLDKIILLACLCVFWIYLANISLEAV